MPVLPCSVVMTAIIGDSRYSDEPNIPNMAAELRCDHVQRSEVLYMADPMDEYAVYWMSEFDSKRKMSLDLGVTMSLNYAVDSGAMNLYTIAVRGNGDHSNKISQCSHMKRTTRLIFKHMGKNMLKKLDWSYRQRGEDDSHLYRLVLKPDDTVQVGNRRGEDLRGLLEGELGGAEAEGDPRPRTTRSRPIGQTIP